MSFFRRMLSIIASFGFICLLFFLLFLGINFLTTSPQNVPLKEDVSVYLQEDVNKFEMRKNNKGYSIYVEFIIPHSDAYYLAYGYHYYDLLNDEIHLTAYNEDKIAFIKINSEGEASLI